jgi:geranylgeranyl diphosphate synthase, type II
MAFQIRDDYLDTFGDVETFGKITGGDILAGKKTFLYVSACEAATDAVRENLRKMYASADGDAGKKIRQITELFSDLGVADKTSEAILHYYEQATQALDSIAIPEERKAAVRDMASMLMDRKY